MKSELRLRVLSVVGITTGALVLAALAAAPAVAAPVLRKQVDQKGDFVLIGNTLAYDCAAGLPAVGTRVTVGTVGACGNNTGDTAPDIFWRADQPADGQARADNTITAVNARSTAQLTLPTGATITYARLYWSAVRRMADDTQVTLERVGAGAFTETVNAEAAAASNVTATTGSQRTFFLESADVTAIVQAHGVGPYRFGGLDTIALTNVDESNFFAAWSLVVFYALDTENPRQLTVFDGLDIVEVAAGKDTLNINLSGFLVPQAGFDAKLGVVAYEGDTGLTGDQLLFNPVMFPTALSNAQNPENNFFNGTRSNATGAVSVLGDLPRLSGTPGSMGGVDMDVVDVTSHVAHGDTTATIRATTTNDQIVTGIFVTSISTFKPDFTATNKKVTNTTRTDGAVRPNDVLEYTISTKNNGNDPGVNVVVTDQLPTGVTYVPGTLRISEGPNTGALTDATGDDQGDVVAGKVTVRLGTGATSAAGGMLGVAATSTVVFRVKVNADATGTVSNQAVVSASGMSDPATKTYPSDGNDVEPGVQPTDEPIDVCAADTDCAAPKPVCRKTTHPFVCVECRTPGATSPECTVPTKPVCDATNTCVKCRDDNDCSGTTPVCHASGKCVECSATKACSGGRQCNIPEGTCGGCITNADCSGVKPICDGTTKECRACQSNGECTVAPDTICVTTGTLAGACGECSSTDVTKCVTPKLTCDTTVAKCVECTTNAQCPPAKPACDTVAKTCGPCTKNADCSAPTPICGAQGVCVGCVVDNDCGGLTCVAGTCTGCLNDSQCNGLTPFCQVATRTCVACTDDAQCGGKNPLFPACQKAGPLLGACTECSESNKLLCRSPKPECQLRFGFCGCTDTDGDSECGEKMSGVVCNAPVGVCTPGCSLGSNRNTCPAGQTCDAVGNAIGTCVIAECVSDASCAAPRPKCDLTPTPHKCVQCLDSTNCVSPNICDTTSKTCVECTQTNKANCSVNGSGQICLDNQTCGCTVDGDCGGPASGRICDASFRKCSPGCRRVGGNGCPATFMCHFPTQADNIGDCVPIPPVDAAVPDTAPDVAPDLAPDVATPDMATPDAGVDAAPDVAPDLAVDKALDLAPDRSQIGDLPPLPDSAVAADSGSKIPNFDGFVSGGGISCAVGGGHDRPASAALWLCLPVGLAFAVRRRRRR
jgi:uncharacterized repeat protein (TIGR01451 family)